MPCFVRVRSIRTSNLQIHLNMKSIKLVKSVAYAYSTQLEGSVLIANRAVRIPSNILWHSICVKNHPSMVSSTKTEDKNKVVTTTLKFLTPDDLNIKRCHLVFKVTLTDDRQFLVGSSERPYPSVEITETCPDAVKENQLNEVVVTYKSLAIPPYIKV